jgi:peroxiredoxin
MKSRLMVSLAISLFACVPEFEGQILDGGFSVGETVPETTMRDQFGGDVSLRDFDGDVVLLDISTMWCAPCQEVATHAEETFLDYRDQGFMYITVLQEDVEAHSPDKDDLARWASAYGITSPVLGDGGAPQERITAPAIENGQFPAILIIGRDGEVVERVGATDDASIRSAIENAL